MTTSVMTVAQLASAAEELIRYGHGGEPVFILQVAPNGFTSREGVKMLTLPMNAFETGFVWVVGSGKVEG